MERFIALAGVVVPHRHAAVAGARVTEAVDVAREAMTGAYQHWSTIEQPRAWARRVASREWARRCFQSHQDLVDQVPEPCAVMRLDADVDAWEQRQKVLALLELLHARQRQIMAWKLDGYTPAEIAENRGDPPSAAVC
ncbi:hypothetical protein [Lentzea sp. NPDC055074]